LTLIEQFTVVIKALGIGIQTKVGNNNLKNNLEEILDGA